MELAEETVESIKARLVVLEKALVSEHNSVAYYRTLIDNTPEETEENIGARRIYAELREEEKKHVQVIQDLLDHWQAKLKEIGEK